MENPRNKRFGSFNLYAALGRVMKSHMSPVSCPSGQYTHTGGIATSCSLVTTSATTLARVLSHWCSRDLYRVTSRSADGDASDPTVEQRGCKVLYFIPRCAQLRSEASRGEMRIQVPSEASEHKHTRALSGVFYHRNPPLISADTTCKSPVEHRIEGFHCVQVGVAIVTSNCEDLAHHRGNAHPAPGRGERGHIIPLVASRVVPLDGAQGRVIIKTSCRRKVQIQ